MFNSDTELLFPSRVIPVLRGLQDKDWDTLIDTVEGKDEQSLEKLSFVLMMVKQTGCLTCNVDAFRALRGCTECSSQAIRRFKGTGTDLIELFSEAEKEIKKKYPKA